MSASDGWMRDCRTRFSDVPASAAEIPDRVMVATADPTWLMSTDAAAAVPTTSPMTAVSSSKEMTPRLTVWNSESLTLPADAADRP